MKISKFETEQEKKEFLGDYSEIAQDSADFRLIRFRQELREISDDKKDGET